MYERNFALSKENKNRWHLKTNSSRDCQNLLFLLTNHNQLVQADFRRCVEYGSWRAKVLKNLAITLIKRTHTS